MMMRVHIDHVDPATVEVFESARRGWLSVLHTAGDPPDGRPLLLSGDASDRVYSVLPVPDMGRPRCSRRRDHQHASARR